MTGPAEAPCLTLEIPAAQEGFRADRALAALLSRLSRRVAKMLFHAGRVRLNGKVAGGDERVHSGDKLECPNPDAPAGRELLRHATAPRLTTAHGRQVARLYEDDAVLVISKPAEILIHRNPDGRTRRETLEDVFERAYPPPDERRTRGAARATDAAGECGPPPGRGKLEDPEEDEAPAARLGPPRAAPGRSGFYFVHRLDMETTGCLLVAKNEAARDALIRAFQERRVKKEYLAVVVGEVPWEHQVVKRPITYRRGDDAPKPVASRFGQPDWARLKKHGYIQRFAKKGVALQEGDPRGKPCETAFTVEQRFRGYTLLRCEPRTGRMHQIRVHLAAEGFPLAYDPLYGRHSPLRMKEFHHSAAAGAADDVVVLNRLPLHALKLGFQHPVTQARVEVEAPLPRDLREFLRLLRKFRPRE